MNAEPETSRPSIDHRAAPNHIGLVANTDWYLYGFRRDFALALSRAGFQVTLLSPAGPYAERLAANDQIQWRPITIARGTARPWMDIIAFYDFLTTYRNTSFSVVHHFTAKCVIYGSLAAKLLGMNNVVNSITGLGYVFIRANAWKGLARWFVLLLFRVALHNTRVIFQNQDDLNYFLEHKVVTADQSFLIKGSGVNTVRYAYSAEQAHILPRVVLPARLLWDKGVREFVMAARCINAISHTARFQLVGDTDIGNPAAIPGELIKEWADRGWVEWLGWIEDMPAVYHAATLICLPSYREGLSKTLIEAASCGRAIITTDIPGCRDVVEHGKTGLLVPVYSVDALVAAIHQLLANPELRAAMGRAGRKKVEREFSNAMIHAQTLAVYQTFVANRL